MKQQFIYGASVQGIQPFIFQTNKLKEIVGASQLVDNICTTEFAKFCKTFDHEITEDNIIMSAAGNIKYLVDETTCQKIVHSFPKYISNYAPGVTISQAVVKRSNNLKDDIDELEKRLKAQRNQPAMPIDIGYMGLERARRTGGVAYKKEEYKGQEIVMDRATDLKRNNPEKDSLNLFKKFRGSAVEVDDVPFDVSDITKKHDNGWLAIVHADGNGLGQLLSNLSKSENLANDSEKSKEAFSRFSKQLDIATQEAAQEAFLEVIPLSW
jgi:CRISPR/Cas system-associated protein Cas10 (large subunit of type III CRISPR-Cas system)